MKEATKTACEIYCHLHSQLGLGSLEMEISCSSNLQYTNATYRWTFKCRGNPMVLLRVVDMQMLHRMDEDPERFAIRLARKWKESFMKTEQQQSEHCPKESQ